MGVLYPTRDFSLLLPIKSICLSPKVVMFTLSTTACPRQRMMPTFRLQCRHLYLHRLSIMVLRRPVFTTNYSPCVEGQETLSPHNLLQANPRPSSFIPLDPEEKESRFVGRKVPNSCVLCNSSPQIINDVFNFVCRCSDEGDDDRVCSLNIVPPLSNEQVVTVVSMLVEKAGPKPASFFFNWAIGQEYYQTFLRLYLAMAGALIHRRNFKMAQEVMRQMVENLAVVGRLKESIDMVLEMQNQGLHLDVHTLNCILRVASSLGSKDLVEYAFMEMVERNGVLPNSCSFKTLVSFYCRMGSIGDIERMLKMMVERGLCIDNVALTAIIGAYSAKGCIGRVHGIIETMGKMGLSMNLINYTTLINGLCRRGSVKQAFEALEEMVGKGLKPNVYTHTALINGLCKKGWTERAFRLFLKLVRSDHYKPNVHTYSSMISGYCKEGKMGRAEMLVTRMQEQGLIPNTVTYSTVIDGHCKDGNFTRANQLLEEMVGKGCIPNITTYNSIIDGLFKKGRVQEAHTLINSALAQGLKFDRYTYTILITENCKRDNVDQALHLFKQMTVAGCEPDMHTYTTLIAAFCKQRNVRDGERLFDEALKIGLVPSKQTYTSMICGHCKEGNVDAALEVLEKMRDDGCMLDSITYGALISGLCKDSRLDKAHILYEEMLDRGLSPCEVTSVTIAYELCMKENSYIASSLLSKLDKKLWIKIVFILIRKLCSQNKVDLASHFVYKILDKGVALDSITVAAFTNACYSCNKYSLAAEVSAMSSKRKHGPLEDVLVKDDMVEV